MELPRRILYFNHDNPLPAGGVRTIYEHVAILNRCGFSAFVVHREPGFKPAWFPHSVPTLFYEPGLNITEADVVVIPEDHQVLQSLKSAALKKVVFCQNHFCLFSGLAGETWHTLGIRQVMASSEVIAEFIRNDLRWPNVATVHYAVDPRVFSPRPKKLQIAYMPRKGLMGAIFIRGLFAALGGPAAQIPWVKIDGLSADQVAATLAESAIFLSLSQLEGFGLPPVEAMACGCAVVGYHGYGGLEYATRDNGFWCEEANPRACAIMLHDVAQRFLRSDPTIPSTIDAGRRTAAKYTAARQEQELVNFMKPPVTQPAQT